MTKPDQTAAAAFWQFSVDVYARPQVAELCLALQDEHDFNVNAVLFCLWSAQTARLAFDQSEIGQVLAAISPIDQNLVHPVRGARRWVRRTIDEASDGDAAGDLAKLYAALKAVELDAERQVQLALIDVSRCVPGKRRASPEAAAQASLENYRHAIAAPEAAAALLNDLVVRIWAPEQG